MRQVVIVLLCFTLVVLAQNCARQKLRLLEEQDLLSLCTATTNINIWEIVPGGHCYRQFQRVKQEQSTLDICERVSSLADTLDEKVCGLSIDRLMEVCPAGWKRDFCVEHFKEYCSLPIIPQLNPKKWCKPAQQTALQICKR